MGRNTFIYVSSDWHQRGIFGARDRATTADFIPGEYSKLYVPNQQAFKAQSIIDQGNRVKPILSCLACLESLKGYRNRNVQRDKPRQYGDPLPCRHANVG